MQRLFLFSASNSSIDFGHAFFQTFLIFQPILASMWGPSKHKFPHFLHRFFFFRASILSCVSTFHWCSEPVKSCSRCSGSVISHFSRFFFRARIITNHGFWHFLVSCWKPFGIHVQYFFGIVFCMPFWMPFFDFRSKTVVKWHPKLMHPCSLLTPWVAPKTLQKRNLDFSWIWHRFLVPT